MVPEPGTQLIAEYGKQLFYDGYITDFNFPWLKSMIDPSWPGIR